MLLVGILSLFVINLQCSLIAQRSDLRTGNLVAESISIRSERGALLQVSKAGSGSPSITWFDENQSRRMALGLTDEGRPRVSLYSPSSKSTLMLAMTETDVPRISVFDHEGHNVVGLGLNDRGDAVLGFYDEIGRRCIAVGSSSSKGTPRGLIFFEDSKGVDRFQMGLDKDDLPHLFFAEEEGESRLSMRLEKGGKALFDLRCPDRIHGIQLAATPDFEAFLKVFDKRMSLLKLP